MTRFKIFSMAAILALMLATPVFAQAAIQEPGAFAFYYPNNDVLNGGRPTPAARMDANAGLDHSVAVTLMPRRTAPRTVLLVLNGTVPMSPFQGRSLDTTVADTSASEPARRLNESDRNWARKTRLHRQRCGLLLELCSR